MQFDYLTNIPDTWNRLGDICISKLDQIIPSPYGMSPFKSLSADWMVSDLTAVRLTTFEEAIDVTGKRVEMYYNVKSILGFKPIAV